MKIHVESSTENKALRFVTSLKLERKNSWGQKTFVVGRARAIVKVHYCLAPGGPSTLLELDELPCNFENYTEITLQNIAEFEKLFPVYSVGISGFFPHHTKADYDEIVSRYVCTSHETNGGGVIDPLLNCTKNTGIIKLIKNAEERKAKDENN